MYFEYMLLNQCSPNDYTLHSLVTGLCNSMASIISSHCSSTVNLHGKGALLDIFRALVNDRCDPRNSAYNAIIFSLCIHNMLGEALDLKNKMANKGYKPDSATFLSLLYGFCSVGKSREWRTILPNEFQRDELEVASRYKILFDQYVVKSVGCEVYSVFQLYLEECRSSKQMELKFANS